MIAHNPEKAKKPVTPKNVESIKNFVADAEKSPIEKAKSTMKFDKLRNKLGLK